MQVLPSARFGQFESYSGRCTDESQVPSGVMTADGSSFVPTESLAGDLVIAVISRGRERGEFWSLFTTPKMPV